MLKVEYARWGQPPEDLRNLSLSADHERTCERFLALYKIALGSYPTELARQTSRHYQTLMRWVRSYNKHGPESQVFCHTGGCRPFAKGSRIPSVEK